MNLQGKYTKSDIKENPLGFELGFTVETVKTVKTAYNKALDEGAVAVSPPTKKPWGQTVAYIRAIEGTLIAFGDPVH